MFWVTGWLLCGWVGGWGGAGRDVNGRKNHVVAVSRPVLIDRMAGCAAQRNPHARSSQQPQSAAAVPWPPGRSLKPPYHTVPNPSLN